MRNSILLTVFFVSQYAANGQSLLRMSDPVTGQPYKLEKYKDVRGSAYLFDEWKWANVTDVAGVTYSPMQVKFDAYDNKFLFMSGDTAYDFVVSLEKVDLFPLTGDTATKMVFKKGFSGVEKLSPNKLVQVLAEGKITAIKHISKTQLDVVEYNSPAGAKMFNDVMTYYFIRDGKTVSQRPSPKLLQEILKDKWAAIDAYMKQNQLNAKSEDDCIKAIKYYNTL